jgi:cyclomaltodextrinase
MRRLVLGRGTALLVLLLVVASCTSTDPSDSSSTTKPNDQMITFDKRGGDTFAWSQEVSGQAYCDDVVLEVNGEAVDAPVDVSGSEFRAEVPIRSGANDVVARCESEGDGEGSASVTFIGRLEVRPTARIDLSVKGDTVVLDGSRSEATEPDGFPIVRYAWSRGPRGAGPLETANGEFFSTASGDRLWLRTPDKDGEYFVSLTVFDELDRSDSSSTYFIVEDGRAQTVDLLNEHPAWIDSSVVYAPIPQLWGNGGPKAVQRRLPYLKKLGVDVLWLWPPTSLRTSGEEYAIDDYFKIDPSWGPKPAFKKMVDEAHRLGLRVIVDFVPNHMSAEGSYFKDTVEHGEASKYWDFFDRRSDGEFTHYFDWTHLPNLNFENPQVRKMVLEATSYWVRDLGIDGFRMDAVWGIKKRRPEFWRKWRAELQRITPDLMLIAEASAVDGYYFSNGFDVAYDWTKRLGHWAWEPAFEFPMEAGTLLTRALTNGGKGYVSDALILRFLNNNDTGARFVDKYSPDFTRVAAVLQFTVAGIPSMFAGDEIGASYEPYSNLTPIVWRDRHGLRDLYKKLIDLKHNVPALHSRDMKLLTSSPGSALSYIRPAVDDSGPVLVVLNFGEKSSVKFSGAGLDEVAARSGGVMRDLIIGDRVEIEFEDGSAEIAMDATSALVLVPGGN